MTTQRSTKKAAKRAAKKAAKPAPVKRIPVGTTVKFSTQPGYYPERVGVVTAIPGGIGAGPNNYIVVVTKTATGKDRKSPLKMRPYASRLEAQNPTKLKVVK